MGQAFDHTGDMLGEAFGNTKNEVFEALNKQFKDAAEIRVKSLDTPMVEPMLQWFEYAHLPLHLQNASKPFCDLATKVGTEWPRNAERTVTLRKLLEAKDAAVRSLLSKA